MTAWAEDRLLVLLDGSPDDEAVVAAAVQRLDGHPGHAFVADVALRDYRPPLRPGTVTAAQAAATLQQHARGPVLLFRLVAPDVARAERLLAEPGLLVASLPDAHEAPGAVVDARRWVIEARFQAGRPALLVHPGLHAAPAASHTVVLSASVPLYQAAARLAVDEAAPTADTLRVVRVVPAGVYPPSQLYSHAGSVLHRALREAGVLAYRHVDELVVEGDEPGVVAGLGSRLVVRDVDVDGAGGRRGDPDDPLARLLEQAGCPVLAVPSHLPRTDDRPTTPGLPSQRRGLTWPAAGPGVLVAADPTDVTASRSPAATHRAATS